MAAGAGARPAPRWLRALAEPLSAAQLRRLEEHRYSAAGISLFEPPLQLYWTWLLQWVPLSIAPNSITLLGLAVNLLTTLVLISYCPTITEEVGPAPRPLLGRAVRIPNCCLQEPRVPRRSSAPSAPQSRRWRRPESGETPPRAVQPPRGRGGADTAAAPAPRPLGDSPGPPRGCHTANLSPTSTLSLSQMVEGLSRSLRAGYQPAWPPPHPVPSCGMDEQSHNGD